MNSSAKRQLNGGFTASLGTWSLAPGRWEGLRAETLRWYSGLGLGSVGALACGRVGAGRGSDGLGAVCVWRGMKENQKESNQRLGGSTEGLSGTDHTSSYRR